MKIEIEKLLKLKKITDDLNKIELDTYHPLIKQEREIAKKLQKLINEMIEDSK